MTPATLLNLYLYFSIPIFLGLAVLKPILAGLSNLPGIALASAIIHTMSLPMPFWTAALSIKMDPMLLECHSIPTDLGRSIFVFAVSIITTTTSWAYYQTPSTIVYNATLTTTVIASIVDLFGSFMMLKRWKPLDSPHQVYSAI